MSASRNFANIPVIIERMHTQQRLHWQRRGLQLLTLVLAVLIPLSGLFRIDPIVGAFIVLDRQIWWSDFSIVFGFWLLLASSLVLLYSSVGTAFCGWSCPQNTISEWANWLTQKMLGKRAAIDLHGLKMQVGRRKNRWLNWAILGFSLLLISMFLAFIPVLYFYPPDVIASFITFRADSRLAGSIHYIYTIFVILVLLDVAFIRHFWCRFMCVYKVWQHGFKTQHTLRIHYDESRQSLCEKCNYCVTACIIDIDPRKTNIYDSCINCGECITACNTLQKKSGQSGLLSYLSGDGEAKVHFSMLKRVLALSTRVKWTLPVILFGLLMFSYGLLTYQPYHLSVSKAEFMQANEIRQYRIAISNKRYRKAQVRLTVEGLTDSQYTLSRPKALFNDVGRIDIQLHIEQQLLPGLHTFIVHSESTDGWKASYRVQHFVAKG